MILTPPPANQNARPASPPAARPGSEAGCLRREYFGKDEAAGELTSHLDENIPGDAARPLGDVTRGGSAPVAPRFRRTRP